MADLEEINRNLIKVCASVEHIKEHVTEMKEEREKHQDAFWNNMNAMKESLRDEQEARKLADQDMKSELGRMKIKVGTVVTVLTVAITGAFNWILRKF